MPTAGPTPARVPRAWILEAAGSAPVEIFGLSPGERLRRSLERAGCRGVQSLGPADPPESVGEGPCLLARADRIYDERLIEELAKAPGTLLVDPASGPAPGEAVAACVEAERLGEALAWLRERRGGAPPGLRARAPRELVGGYIALLRKHEPAYLHPALPELARRIEELAFDAAYKGSTDLVTKWVWPRPARAATRWLAARGVHPNAVTLASWVLAIAAGWLFAVGWFATGLAIAWLMTFLDTVDGKLARVTLRSSPVGHVLDHSLDLLHPPFWWLAWGFGGGDPLGLATWVVVGGYLLGRLEEGLFLLAFGMEMHCWRPIDALFRTVTARRNPNLLLLSVAALAGRSDLGLPLVAIWTAVSLGFHAVRLAQAFALSCSGRILRPFDESGGPAARPRQAAGAPGVGTRP
jgi:phosphatidylglycerophosphate synthase